MSKTKEFAVNLMEELNVETVFTIPVSGGIKIAESVVVTWIIMAIMVGLSILFVRNLKVENPGKKQLAMEAGYSFFYHFFDDMLGEHGRRYISYLITIVWFIGIANMIGLFGLKPPTKDLGVTVALAIMSIVLIEYSSFHARGFAGKLLAFADPVPLLVPINILELFIRPLSLCMRLFGNVLGSFVVMELLRGLCAWVLPVPFSLYFDIFDGFIQAYVFAFLTSLFMKEAIE
ncbi:F-type H+-transporting ATPase subunit a [[Clostridium] polysaccharolyticum]|uniref:ATP synthase subunit a n=2 Tax=[Clostridium] polysaccharolyticum TaxID=29364 RepID=A0A1H9ZZS0_9FIRM|nr:F0F1 ATP synthase subunit A [[Clostridium] polysaccharolyticum]SES86413.1 F-type H+-transporting ATPase subunit a [[Clostridium] polysaccharolyticum]